MFTKLLMKIILGSYFYCFAINLFAQTSYPPIPSNMIVGVSVDDLHEAPMSIPLPMWKVAKNIIRAENFVSQVIGDAKVDSVYGYFIRALPEETRNQVIYHLVTVIRFNTGSGSFRSVDGDNDVESPHDVRIFTFDLMINKDDNSSYVANLGSPYFAGGGLHLAAEVSLVERKLIVSDARLGIKFVMPIGVGAFDLGVMNPGKDSLLTPRFKTAYISNTTTMSRRNKPRFYGGKPFIRVVDGATNRGTEIGFHIEINDEFIRGFDSHGCMRLREQDLYLLHDLVMNVQYKIPLTVSYRIADTADHPVAKRNYGFKEVSNIGSDESPEVDVDIEGLTVLEYTQEAPPVGNLVDQSDDHFQNKYIYDGTGSFQRQQEKHLKDCQAQYYSQSDVDKCMKQYEKSFGIGDYLKHWWNNL